MLEAFRTIEIPVDIQDKYLEIRVPFDVDLLHKVEDTLKKTTGKTWFVFERSDKSIIETYEEFCRPYFPADFDWSKVQPTFAAFFFRYVKEALVDSIKDCERSMMPTETPTQPTEEKTMTPDPLES